MKRYILFGNANEHPLAWLLNREYRHVWCIMETDHCWVSYDWGQGVPTIRAEADLDYDIVGHYEEHGWEVVEVTDHPVAVGTPLVLNNCVGHVKSVLGIASWALTPYQLYKWATRQPRVSMLTVPGFGGGGGQQQAFTPPPTPTKVKKSPEEDYPKHEDPDKRRRLRAGKSNEETEETKDTGTLLK